MVHHEWSLYYAGYIVEDSYRAHRTVNDVFNWTVAFAIDGCLTATPDSSKSATQTSDWRYRVVAEVIRLSEKWCVIDFGLNAIGESGWKPGGFLPEGCKCGDYVSGEILIDLPLCMEAGTESVLQMIDYRFHVNRISADLTPLQKQPSGEWIRDESQIRYLDVDSTKAVRANGYILHCSVMEPTDAVAFVD